MKQKKKFFLNGEQYCIKDEINLLDLLIYFNFPNQLFVVEYNTSICKTQNWSTISVQNNDKIEIITIVGGG